MTSVWEASDRARRHLLLTAAAILGVGADHWASHASAAVVHGLPTPFATVPVHLTHPPGTATRYLAGLRVMAASLPEAQRTVRRGIPVTTEDRCVADCLRHLSTVDAVAIADAALRRDPRLRAAVTAVLDSAGTWPFSTRAKASWALADGRRESPAESWSYVVMHRQALPLPEPRARVYDERGRFIARVDAWWDDQAVAGEVDGLVMYGVGADLDPEAARQALLREKRREEALRRVGAHVTRWGTRDLRDERRWAGTIRDELSSGEHSRFRGTVRRTPPV